MQRSQIKPQTNVCGTIIDSGASTHMFGDKEDFGDLLPTSEVVFCANGTKTKATHQGFVDVNLEDGSVMHLQNVLRVPNLKKNLVSVRALNKDGNDVLFKRDGTVILTNNESSRQIGHAIGDLYRVNIFQ